VKWVVRVWSLPDDPDGFRFLCEPPVIDVAVTDRDDASGTGRIKVPADYEYLHLIRHTEPGAPDQSRDSLIALHRVENGQVLELPDVEFYSDEAEIELTDDGPVVTIFGDVIRAGPDDGIVAPYSDTIRDWVWDGETVTPPLKLKDLGHINEQWEIYLSGERYVLNKSGSTAGTFTLTVLGNTTDEIAWNAGASDIKKALEDLDGIDEVSVIHQQEQRRFLIVFERPKDLASDMTADFSGLTGTATLTKSNDGFNPDDNPTFTITVDGETTNALAWNASTDAIEGDTHAGTGLQGLPNVADVTVQGSGKASDPWVIIFYAPPKINTLTVSFSGGTAVARRTVVGRLDPSPITRSMYMDRRTDEKLHGEYGDPPIEVVTDVLNPNFADSEWSLKVNATAQFGGSQIPLFVEPGMIYQVGIPVMPTVSGRYRLVIRDRYDELIRWHSPNEIPLTANEWSWLRIPDVVIPAGVTEIIMRVAVVSDEPGSIAPFYVDWQHAYFKEGWAPNTIGYINRQLFEAIQARGALRWLQLGFTDTHSSAGNPWDEDELSWRADVGEKMAEHQLTEQKKVGYESEIVRLPGPYVAGEPTHELRLYNPGEAGQVSDTHILKGVLDGGRVGSRRLPFTHLLVENDLGETEWVTDSLFDGLARRESFMRAEFAPDLATAVKAGHARIANELKNLLPTQVRLSGDTVVPYRDFRLGWTVPYSVNAPTHDRRISSITLRFRDGVWEAEVTASAMFPEGDDGGGAATREAIRKLYAEFRRRRHAGRRRVPEMGSHGTIPDVVVAASNTKFKEAADLVCPGNGLDHLTIQQALDRLSSSGGWVHLLEGDYEISDNVDVQIGSGRVVRVTGAGTNLTRIKLAGGVTVDSVFRITNPTPGGTAIFDDLTINGNKSASGTSAVSMIRVAQQGSAPTVYLNRVRVVDSPGIGIGSTVRTAGTWRFHHVIVENSAGAGVQLGETSSMHTGCRYTGNGGDGFNAGALGLVHQFIGCRIDNNGDDGIEHSGAQAGARIVVVGCAIHGNGGDGVIIGQFAQEGVVVANEIYGNGSRSVASANSQTVVLGNLIEANGTDTPTPDHGNMVGGTWTGGSGSGVTDHGDLDGLEDDDHTQYLTEGRHDAHDHSTALGTASIGDLSDVDLSTPPADGEALVWDSGASAFVPGEVAAPDIGGVYAETIGDGSSTSFPVEHNLGTEDVVVQLWDLTGMVPVLATDDADSIEVTDENAVTVTFSGAPAIDSYRVVIVAGGSEGGGGSGTDEDAIHLSEAGEINSLDSVTPAGSDVLVLEDASDGFAKAKTTVSALADVIGGGGDLPADVEGGTETDDGTYQYNAFTTPGAHTLTVNSPGWVDVLLVGGGGGGAGRDAGGGGGGGEVRFLRRVWVDSDVKIIVGAGGEAGTDGGTGATASPGRPGAPSVFGPYAAAGGGYGGSHGQDGGFGGSGGGGGRTGIGGTALGVGGNGGNGSGSSNNDAGGGGGGAGEPGANGATNKGGDGGDGIDLSEHFPDFGDSGWFGGGGGGATHRSASSPTAGSGGQGGGGGGGIPASPNGNDGMDGTGGGGGAGCGTGNVGGKGGDGIVIVRTPL